MCGLDRVKVVSVLANGATDSGGGNVGLPGSGHSDTAFQSVAAGLMLVVAFSGQGAKLRDP